MRRAFSILTLLFLIILGPGVASLWASPSGLNNISTTDVVPQKILVFQAYTDIGDDNKPDYFMGFKYGPMKNLEVGFDGRIFPESSLEETVTAQAKYRFEVSKSLTCALGVSNLGDRARTGWENPYLVFSYNLSFLRAHLGTSFQRDNEGVFVGVDKTIKFWERDFTWRSDLIQTNDGHDITTSFGFIYDLGHNFLWESWMSFPAESGKEDALTLKLNYVIKF